MESVKAFFDTIPSGIYALAGSLLVAIAALAGQWKMQREENRRHARRCAYDCAFAAWKLHFEFAARAEKSCLPLAEYVVYFQRLVDTLPPFTSRRFSNADIMERIAALDAEAEERGIEFYKLELELRKRL